MKKNTIGLQSGKHNSATTLHLGTMILAPCFMKLDFSFYFLIFSVEIFLKPCLFSRLFYFDVLALSAVDVRKQKQERKIEKRKEKRVEKGERGRETGSQGDKERRSIIKKERKKQATERE